MAEHLRLKWLLSGILIVLLLLGALTPLALAQDGDTVRISVSTTPESVIIGETELTVNLTLTGDTAGCVFVPEPRAVDAVLLMDVSPSMSGGPLVDAKAAAQVFVQSMKLALPVYTGDDGARRGTGDQVGLVTFASSANELSPLTQDSAQLLALVDDLTTRDGTNISTGLRQAFRTVTSAQHENIDAVSVIVLLSDGEDQVDSEAVIQAADTAKAGGVRIVTVAFGSSADEDMLREIATSPADFHEALTGDELSALYGQIAQTIQPSTAATDLLVNYRFNDTLFELVPNSTEPPASAVSGNMISWVRRELNNGEEATFSFRVRGLQPGAFSVGDLVDSSYLPCTDTVNRRVLIGSGPSAVIELQPPTPTPTATPIPPTPTPLPTSTPPAAVFATGQTDTSEPTGSTSFCKDGNVWNTIIPLIIALLLLVLWLIWAVRNWSRIGDGPGQISFWCFVSRAILLAYILFLVWLFARPFVGSLCDEEESVYFWRMSPGGTTGIYLTAPGTDSSVPFGQINEAGCVGCHTVSSNGEYVAAIHYPPPGELVIYRLDGSRVPIPSVNANYASPSPDGSQVVYADYDGNLSILNVETGETMPLAGANDPNVLETMPSWGPDGKIAFVRTADLSSVYEVGLAINGPTDIYTIPETGGEATGLAGAVGNGFNYYPAYSPDGRWLAYTHHNHQTTYSDPDAEIWLLPAAEGGTPIRLAANDDANGNPIPHAANSWPSWSRNGEYLAFNSQRDDPSFDLYLTEVDANGNSTTARPIAGASEVSMFEHLPFWGTPIDQPGPFAQVRDMWPWLLPLLPLFFLMWWLCSNRKKDKPEVVREPVVPPAEKPSGPLDPISGFRPDLLWEVSPALIVGLGNSGRWVLTHLKKNLLDANNGVMPANIRLLCIDTGDYTTLKQRRQDGPVSFAGVELSADEVVELTDNLRPLIQQRTGDELQYRGWLGDAQRSQLNELGAAAVDLQNGANGQRTLARAGFLRHLNSGQRTVWTMLQDMIPICLDPDNGRRLDAIIVGDTYGDVSSAILFDMALLIRKASEQVHAGGCAITAHLLTHRSAETTDHERLQQINTAATLREMMRFQLAGARPFPIHLGNPELDGICNWLPLDNIQLYDGTHLGQSAPKRGMFPAVADTITMWLDRASKQEGKLRTVQIDMRSSTADEIRNKRAVHVSSQGIYLYRLPFAELIDNIRVRFMQETVRRLLRDEGKGRPTLDPSLVQEAFGGSQNPQDVARYFLIGQEWGLEPHPKVLLNAYRLLLEGSEKELTSWLNDQRLEAQAGPMLVQRLRAALGIILNGRDQVSAQNIYAARGAKLGFALSFLNALESTMVRLRSQITGRAMNTQVRKTLEEALDALQATTVKYRESLDSQAHALLTDEEESVYTAIMRRNADLTARRVEMDAVETRKYIWEHDPERPAETAIADRWYKQYMFPQIENAMRRLFWDVSEDAARLKLIGTGSEVFLDPNDIGLFDRALYDLATYYSEKIRKDESLADVLQHNELHDGKLRTTSTHLLNAAQPEIDFRPVLETNEQHYLFLIAPEGMPQAGQLEQLLSEQLTDLKDLVAVQNTDKFTIGVSRQLAVVPLDTVASLASVWVRYRTEYGLVPGRPAPAAPILTAVFEAEAAALEREQKFVEVLNTAPDPLHPLIVTALTESERAKIYCLALAAGEVQLRSVRGSDRQMVWLLGPDDEYQIKPHAMLNDPRLHPLAWGLLSFVLDKDTFGEDFIAAWRQRYETDAGLPARWRAWRSQESRWQAHLSGVDDYNRPIVEDLLKIARVWSSEYGG